MIDYEKLDKLMELPVSEEMLGAYIEGNLSPEEALDISALIEIDNTLKSLLAEADIERVDDFTESVMDGVVDIDNTAGSRTRKRAQKEVDDSYDDIV